MAAEGQAAEKAASDREKLSKILKSNKIMHKNNFLCKNILILQ